LIAPPIGNSFENQAMAGVPLIFWSVLALFGGLCLYLVVRHEASKVFRPQENLEEV
jgi:hypothetical protein